MKTAQEKAIFIEYDPEEGHRFVFERPLSKTYFDLMIDDDADSDQGQNAKLEDAND